MAGIKKTPYLKSEDQIDDLFTKIRNRPIVDASWQAVECRFNIPANPQVQSFFSQRLGE